MAIQTYTAANREIVIPLNVDYGCDVAVALSYASPQFCYTRRAMKTYLYKGLDEATVKACLADKRRLYRRRFMGWKLVNGLYRCVSTWYSSWGAAPADYFAQVAQFNVVRNGTAPVFNVQITVDETVALYSTSAYDIGDAAGVAALENLFVRTVSPLSYAASYSYEE